MVPRRQGIYWQRRCSVATALLPVLGGVSAGRSLAQSSPAPPPWAFPLDLRACFEGAGHCCNAAAGHTELAACCDRAVQNCWTPRAPLLFVSHWPAALGNAIVQLHDAVLLAALLGRALVVPPVFGDPLTIDLEALAREFAIDVLIVTSLDWRNGCGEQVAVNVFEVSGSARAGPYRNEHLASMMGPSEGVDREFERSPQKPDNVWLYQQLFQNPEEGSDGILQYSLRGKGPLGGTGRWWATNFPLKVQIFYWEFLLKASLSACSTAELEAQVASNDKDGSIDEDRLPDAFKREQEMKQHACLVPLLRAHSSPAASERCLVLAQLYQSLHWRAHPSLHARFFSHFSFSDAVESAAARAPFVARPVNASSAGARHQHRRPYVALHLRTFLRESMQSDTEMSSAIIPHLRDAMRAVRQQRPSAGIPRLFIATDNATHPAVEQIKRSLIRSYGKRTRGTDQLVFTSADTKPLAEGGDPQQHAAIDAFLCTRAEAFVGTQTSSLTAVVALIRAARRVVRANMSFAADEMKKQEAWVSFWPNTVPQHLNQRLFPTSPALPTPMDILRFYEKMYAIIKHAPRSWKGGHATSYSSDCAALQTRFPPHWPFSWSARYISRATFGSPVKLLDDSILRVMWTDSFWACAPLAVMVHLYWLTAHLNGTRDMTRWVGQRRMIEQGLFMHKVWNRIFVDSFRIEDLASPRLRSTSLALLRGLIGLESHCKVDKNGDGEIGFAWNEGLTGRVTRTNRLTGDCQLSIDEIDGIPLGSIIIDVNATDFFCPSSPPFSLHGIYRLGHGLDSPEQRRLAGLLARSFRAPPVAIRLVHKAASTSAVAWAAAMEGLVEVHNEILELVHTTQDGFYKLLRFVRGQGCTSDTHEPLMKRLTQYMPRFVSLPPQFCPSRCEDGAGRLKVAVVRHPFKRLASYFASLMEASMAGERNSPFGVFTSWDNFKDYVIRLIASMSELKQSFCSGKFDLGSGEWDVWRHLLSGVSLLTGRDECKDGSEGRWRIADYHIVHLETANADILALERRLCVESGDAAKDCLSLPRMSLRNTGATRIPPPSFDALWDAETVNHTMGLYGEDFVAFGYVPNPSILRPFPHVGTQRE
eukprot:TRINITY_DN75254_c0_g1_i1.p1 TRINITY_DN75254_c0_g1~~TRINITY_DN75254_c0_g1_i1.p1  ORF type:complete len:1101 (-),score=111.55 TRINITY_DN75254_c0_g1_i1:26-3328(-)